MSVETRGSAARAAAGSVVNAAANLAREQISADQVLQWTLEGRCYTGSIEMETAGAATLGTLSELTPFASLRSDRAGTKLVIPIMTQVCQVSGSGSDPLNYAFTITRPWNETAVLTTESGTALTVLNNLGVGYGNHTATALHTVTVAALDGTGDHTEARHFIHGVKGIDADAFADLSLTVNWLKDGAPIVLYKGSALLIYAYTGDGAGTARPVFQWAELDAATYLP